VHAVSLEDVSWSIDGIDMLRPTTFAVAPGRCTVLTGPNGSGKTTLLRIASGRLRPTTGTAAIFGTPADDRDERVRREVSDLLGAPGYYDDLTLADHLDFLGRLWDVRDTHRPLDELGCAHLALRYLDEMSSGQRQLAFLALVLARPARVLMLDEPEQRLDAGYRERLGEVLARRRDEGAAILVATHDASLRDRIADETIELAEAA